MGWPQYARGRHRTQRTSGSNKTEREYADLLDWQQRGGAILWHLSQSIGLRLADNDKLFYYPDELVLMPDGILEVHEVKGGGGSEDDSLVKIKVAADRFPFRFRSFQKMDKKHGGGWKERVFGGEE